MGKKNNSYTASYKLKVISFAEQFGNRAAEREFGILKSSVRHWRKQKEAVRNTERDSRAFLGPKEFIVIIINLITDKSKLCYKITNQDLHTKKRIFYAPRFFSGQNRTKSAQITRANTVFIYVTRLASNEIFSSSNKIHREVGRAKDLSAPLCNFI